MVNMWLSVWIVCSIAALGGAEPAPTPPPEQRGGDIGSGEGDFSYGWSVEARGGAGGHHERGAGAQRDGQFYVQLQEGEEGSHQSVQYTADSRGYHPLLQYHAAGPQHRVTASFALGQRALELLHGNTQASTASEQSSAPAPTPGDSVQAPEPSTASSESQQYPKPRDYYIITYPFVSPPTYINAQLSPGLAPSTIQEPNGEALARHTNSVGAPVQYVLQQPSYTEYTEQQAQAKESNQEYFRTKAEPSDDSNDNTVQVSSPPQLSREDIKTDELTTPLIQVFTNQNCTEESKESKNTPEPPASYIHSARLYAEVPSYDDRNVYSSYDESFGAKVSSISSGVKGNRDSNGRERYNYKTERMYISTALPTLAVFTTMTPIFNVTDGISKLVASTQDLISNDDLLDINHAAEDAPPDSDDLIKPKPKNEVTKLYPRNNENFARSTITVSAQIGKLIDTMIEHQVKHQAEESRQDTINMKNQYSFATPIVVQGSTASDFKSQIRDNILSTVVPYLADGYELAAVRNDLQYPSGDDESRDEKEGDEGSVKVTPRPVSQKFLAPLTVGLRLIHSNDTEVLNNVEDDHEVSDSELVSDTVEPDEERARRGKTIVEVQQSIPIEFTEINDIVIQHDDSRDGKQAQEQLRSLQQQFNMALESSKKIQNNMNLKLYRYGAQQVLIHPEGYRSKLQAEEQAQVDEENRELKQDQDTLDIQTGIDVHQEGESQQNERKEFINAYNNHFGEKIIQPIIIEKEVPVTKFVDRFIEKKVPYPQPVEVVKEISVEKPVPYPVTVEKFIDRPYEVTRYVDRPRDVMVPHPVPYEVKVPYAVEKKIYVDRPVHVAVPVEKVIEKQVGVPVPTPVGIPVPVEQTVLYPVAVDKPYPVPYAVDRPVAVDRIVEKEVRVPYAIEKRVPYPVAFETKVAVPYAVEKRVPYPVDRIVEKPVTITKYVDRPIHIQVPFPQPVPVPVPQPYPVDRIVEKRIPYPVDRIVEKIVEKQVPVHVNVPYPVEKIVEKIVTKYVDKPYPVEKRVPYPVPYEKIVEKKIPYPVEVKVPYEVKAPYQVEKIVDRPVHGPYRAHNDYKPANYAIPGPPYHQHPSVDHQYGPSSPRDYMAASQINPANSHASFLPPLPAQIQTNISFDKGSPNVRTTQWGNLYASSYQYMRPKQPDTFHQKTPNLGTYIGYLTNQPTGGPSASGHTSPRLVEWKLRRTDRTPRLTQLRIEYGGFKPPLVPSTEVDLDGLPVQAETTH